MKTHAHVLALMLFASSIHAQDYPADALPSGWDYTSDVTSVEPGADPWWETFNSPMLTALIRQGMEANYDVRIAANRLAASRAMVRSAQSAYYPTIGLNASYNKTRPTQQFGLGASVNWEVDLFGKITDGVRAAIENVKVSQADLYGSQLSMAAEIATNYITLCQAHSELSVMRQHLKSQQRVVEIAEARHKAGLVSELDVAQARVVYFSTQAEMPALESQMTSAANAISTLLGVYGDSLKSQLFKIESYPDYRQIVSAGVPMDLLRRRPDIVAAEHTLAACAAKIGVAKKDFLPTLSLQGSIGTYSTKFKHLFGHGSLGYEVNPTLSWTLFDGFSRASALTQSKIDLQTALDQYNLAIVTAVNEVDNAIAAYAAAVATVNATSQALAASQEATNLSISQYKDGIAAFTTVADAQISWLENANAMVLARAQALQSLISLYKALGGSPYEN